jgi:TonB family protein
MRFFFHLFCVSSFFFFPNASSAQIWKLGESGAQLAREIRPLKLKRIAVADFTSPDSTVSPSMAHYLALFLSDVMRQRDKKHLDVMDHNKFDAALTKSQIKSSMENFVQLLRAAPDEAVTRNADIVIVGTAVKREANYLLEMTPVRRGEGLLLDSVRVSVKLSEFLESLGAPFPASEFQPVFRAGVGGVGIPQRVHTPDPSYNDLARAARIQGTCVLEVVISREGRVVQIHPTKLIGYGLDEDAYNVLKGWEFTPAKDKDGKPVNIVVPIEISFRLFVSP